MRKLPLTRMGESAAPDPAQASASGNKWERRKKRGKAKHATPADTEVPVRITDDAAQEIRAAAASDELEDLDEDLEEATADA
jgi:hypothetical protein